MNPLARAVFARGLLEWPEGMPNPLGPGSQYAVRSTHCAACAEWVHGLWRLAQEMQRYGATQRPEAIIARHTAPNANQELTLGNRHCATCVREAIYFMRHGCEPPAADDVVRFFVRRVAAASAKRGAA